MNKFELLNLKLEHYNFHENFTIRDYFCELLVTLWDKGEGFSGKRPFGNSGWKYDLYKPLIKANLVEGSLDEDGDINELNTKQADNLIRSLIVYCFYGKE